MRGSLWIPWAAATHARLQGQRNSKLVSDQAETISGRSGGVAKGHNPARLRGGLEVSWVLPVSCSLRSGHCLGFLDAQQKGGVGKDFCLLKTGVGIQ